MTMLSQRTLIRVCRTYHQTFNLHAYPISVNGELLNSSKKSELIFTFPSAIQNNAYGIQEAIHWGEPYIFNFTPEIATWVVPMVDKHSVQGGLLSSPVLYKKDKPIVADISKHLWKHREKSVQSLIDHGITLKTARRYVSRLPVLSSVKIRDAAIFLQKTFYQISGWKPVLLEENRVKAIQQRQITAAINEQKKSGQTAYPIDKERMLLSLIKAGDQNGARRLLNEMLAAMFLFSPKLVVLRARTIEMMGYLTRAAIEDCHLMEPLIERNHQWMQRLIRAPDFETLSHVLMKALDDFMEGIYAHGFNCYNPKVSRVLDFLAQHYTSSTSLKQIADEMGLSTFRVSHIVKEHTGKTVLQHITRLRIQKALQLLERTSMSCPEIAYEVGYCDQSYFIKQFKRVTGTTPARHRRAQFMPRNYSGTK